MINDSHRKLVEALEARSYKNLLVKRFGDECYLIIKLIDEDRVFVDRSGNRLLYRHVWQVRDWLHKRFGIPESEVDVDVIRE